MTTRPDISSASSPQTITRTADAGNWQARAEEFRPGQSVRLTIGTETDEGRVVAVWQGIGMVDVEWPHAAYRHPVEDLQIVNAGDDIFVTPQHEDVPGGPGSSAQVSEGAPQNNIILEEDPRVELVKDVDKTAASPIPLKKMAIRVAAAFVKSSLYWHARDRKYRVSREEHQNGAYRCPKRGCGSSMRQATYKMENGSKIKLQACPQCLFMIRASDILADHCDPVGGC